MYYLVYWKFACYIVSLNQCMFPNCCSFVLGTNGGVSIIGTLASILGGLLVGIGFYFALIFSVGSHSLADSPPQMLVILIAAIAGGLGSAVDSVLGATCQYSGKKLYLYNFQHQEVIT